MADPQTFWLTVTNVALAVVTLAALLAVAGGIAQECLSRLKARRATLRELNDNVFRVLFNAAMTDKSIPTEIE